MTVERGPLDKGRSFEIYEEGMPGASDQPERILGPKAGPEKMWREMPFAVPWEGGNPSNYTNNFSKVFSKDAQPVADWGMEGNPPLQGLPNPPRTLSAKCIPTAPWNAPPQNEMVGKENENRGAGGRGEIWLSRPKHNCFRVFFLLFQCYRIPFLTVFAVNFLRFEAHFSCTLLGVPRRDR